MFRLPAGVYGVEGTGGHRPGPLTVTVDGEFGPQWTSLGPLDASPAAWRREFTPARAGARAGDQGGGRPLRCPSRQHRRLDVSSIAARFPEHVARYGPAVVFLVSGQAFMERGGTWVEGGQSADFVISADGAAPVRLLVRNPPVSNVVTLEGDGWRQYFVLAPGEERMTMLPFPPGSRALKVRVTAAHGAQAG